MIAINDLKKIYSGVTVVNVAHIEIKKAKVLALWAITAPVKLPCSV